jgi:hypothetical protein
MTHAVRRDGGKGWAGVYVDGEAEVRGVEFDSGGNVVDHVANADAFTPFGKDNSFAAMLRVPYGRKGERLRFHRLPKKMIANHGVSLASMNAVITLIWTIQSL